jgi:hypothetical protein
VSGNSSVARGRATATSGRQVFRLHTPVVLWWIWVVFAVANVIDLAVQGSSAHFVLRISVILLAVTGLVYVLALRPRVVAEQAGLRIVNPFRDHHVPWAVIQAIDSGDWVRVHHTGDGSAVTDTEKPGKTIECWALYLSARTKRKIARGTPPPRSSGLRGIVRQPIDEAPRLPAEAKYLASLPVAKAIAVQLDNLAAKQRARGAQPAPVIARWAWFPIAAVIGPAVALLIAVLA